MEAIEWSIDLLAEYKPEILKALPEELRDLKEVQEIIKAVEGEFNKFYSRAKRSRENFIVSTANEDGVAQWESYLDIQREPTDSLADRKVKILSRLNERIPYTMVQLYRMLASICGWDGFSLELKDLVLTVRLNNKSGSMINSIMDLLQRVVPMYIVWMVGQEANVKASVKSLGFYGIGTHLTVLPIVEHNIETETSTFTSGAIVLGRKIHILPKE